jgi:hypothetical protein
MSSARPGRKRPSALVDLKALHAKTSLLLQHKNSLEEAFSKADRLNADDCHHQLKTFLPRIW